MQEITYCRDCEKFCYGCFREGRSTYCVECEGINVITIQKVEGGISIEEAGKTALFFSNIKEFKDDLKIFHKLIELSREKVKEKKIEYVG